MSRYSDKSDDELLKVCGLLNRLKESEDVRPIIDAEFGLKEKIFGKAINS